jgi:murein L,D-transpeptidase YafK
LCIFLYFSHPVFAATKNHGRGTKVPAALIKWPAQNSKFAILVDKSTQKVLVYNTDDLSKPVRTYHCSTGENKGPKTRQNDKKTPEGIYFFTDSFNKHDLTPIYGNRAFPVDYPNELDRVEGKDGYGIWFHGTNKPLKPNDTNGCIALENGNIDSLAQYIDLKDTPTVISSALEMVEKVELEKERVALELFVEGWRSTWENKQINEYMNFYGNLFRAGKKDKEDWRRHKAGLARRYPWIKVELDNLRLLQHNGTILAIFYQHYKSPAIDSHGEKRLYLRRNSEEWKIVGEYFTPFDERKIASLPKKPNPLEKIQRLVDHWGFAWENEDIEKYISFYDRSFRSRGMNVSAWKRHRQKLNRKYQTIGLNISDLKIEILNEKTARVIFKQDYQADDYRDYGLKTLLLIKRGENWKIKKEEWKALKRNPA